MASGNSMWWIAVNSSHRSLVVGVDGGVYGWGSKESVSGQG